MSLSPADIRAAREAEPQARPRDLAAKLGIAEAGLCAAFAGAGVIRIEAHPDRLIPALAGFGPVMALTRNESCVIEKVGTYDNFRPGPHAALVVNEGIDLRLFPGHWVHAFAVEGEGGKRSVQIFDAAGDAIHKIHLRPESNAAHWDGFVAGLRLADQGQSLTLTPRKPPEPAKANPDRADELRAGWDELTDTHQFLRLTSRLKMNRLGAYRIAGLPYARRLAPGSVESLLRQAADVAVPIMVFVGNQGCIEIHTGPIARVVETGPWINVLDPGFDLHLRMDHIAEIYAVVKNTQRGPAHSVEFFAADGALIAQIFGVLRAGEDAVSQWNALVAALPEGV
ncbi:hemin-degrading factor [Paenirhodobacter populi]|uniref:Hemin-degrading factor n=1 Tax=Paenirhodobacter populi TaxID=2306993 RepID=A0A443JEV2_9RHOB|nr:ChuX/HutX family heme-like substrate-binding protein [Sinirhodobacter populi]RWR18981.1 hemin-degrading factor [Sinirhodobacter populi]